jgi:hypothetical protein
MSNIISKKYLILITIIFLLFNYDVLAFQDTIPGIGIITPTEDDTSKSGVYIPKNMEECIEELEELIPEEIQDSMKILNYNESLRNFGNVTKWMLEEWCMWDTSVIVKYFSDYGFTDPVEISLGIFKSFWNYLNALPIKIELRPKCYVLNKNLFIKIADTIKFPEKRPNPKGIIRKDSSSGDAEFIFMGRKFTLIDSLYDPIIKLILDNGFKPSDSLWYIWWTKIAKFGYGEEELPDFITEDEYKSNYNSEDSYNVDFILIVENESIGIMKRVIRNNHFDDSFLGYIKTKKHFGFYLIRKREVIIFD